MIMMLIDLLKHHSTSPFLLVVAFNPKLLEETYFNNFLFINRQTMLGQFYDIR